MGGFTLPQLKAVESYHDTAGAEPSSSGGRTQPDVEPKLEPPTITKTTAKVQDDDDMCPSCLGPVVPTAPDGGNGIPGSSKKKAGQATELIWIGCEGCEYGSASIMGNARYQGPQISLWNAARGAHGR
jgi:hypothetical protein